LTRAFFYCAFSTWDAEREQWKRRFKSTGTGNRKEAEQICATWARAAKAGRSGKLTPDSAREIISRGVADVFTAASRDTLPSRSVRDWCAAWLEGKTLESTPATVARYEGIIARFTVYLGRKADRDVASLTVSDVKGFRDALARDLSTASANLGLKTLRACLNSAFKTELVTGNVASKVDKIKVRGAVQRRGFKLPEIKRVLKAAAGSEWYGMTLAGLYCGARLTDILRLAWRNVDLSTGTLSFVAGKTGSRLSVPLAKPLADYLTELQAPDSPDAPIFPRLSTQRASSLSKGFRLVLAEAGLATAPTDHHGSGKGRDAAREISVLSFHSLRHSFVSILKDTGANEAVAMALAGHETKAVSRNYTHMDEDVLRAAVDRLPDVTASPKAR
jgi:integrase